MKNLLIVLNLLLSSSAFSQDTLRVMYYNLLNFPSTLSNRYEDQRVFLQYAKPDVFAVCELDNEVGADLILDSALNVYGNSHYQRANFVNGVATDNCLFYNSDILGLVSQTQIGTVLRDISVYRLYYKAPNLSAQTDTIYFWFFTCHLKAGSGDYQQRNQEIQQAKFYLNDIADEVENVFIGGDFNFYSGFESGCQTVLNAGLVPMIDPANAIGNWSGDWSYAEWHTQSTRNSGVGGGAGGGLDDRFDLIFVSEDVMNNQNGVTYISNSYTPLGQDGNHFNTSIIDGPNAVVPDSVANALYSASDHLPVMMDVVLDETASLPIEKVNYIQAHYQQTERTIQFTTSLENFDLVLFDLMGKEILKTTVTNKSVSIPTHLYGIYIWSIRCSKGHSSSKIAIY